MRNNLLVIDTNTLVSAFIFRYSNPRKAFEKAVKEGEVFASLKTYDEFSEILLRPKFDRYISSKGKLLALKEYKELSIFTEVSETITTCRDPKDDKFPELAVSANVSCIISRDKDLLALHPFRNIPILDAVEFFE